MKREIKFRAKRVKTFGKYNWLYGDLIKLSIIDPFTYIAVGIGYKVYNVEIGKPIKVLPDTVGQYTGLHDRNGVEIYEGDIVKWHLDSRGDTSTCEVKMVLDHNRGTLFLYPSINSTTEIIGNIYENPELLEKS